ncbi:DedA family protein [Sphingomonas rubra]|uniref:Membrane protein DedA, SNARE-associated domain n=1 Tax=Sphingomonas rubra TaxID=634430 RepID=A0A1I5TVQ8_9SPHN|nr:DedA family protein [Sphingomonas rubra]SFP86687.1 membrane protein DedA, SNARE-associated domain [Sphingomonas rubra]
MSVEGLIAQYGLAAVFLGAGIEGETAVIAGGVLAHQGLVSPLGAGLAAAAGSFAADQGFFQIGRHFREGRLVRGLRGRPTYARAIGLLERHPSGFIFAYRFLYGLRTVSPIAIGTSRIALRQFVLVNLAAAVVWATLFTGVGFLFGNVLSDLFGRIGGRRLLWGIVAAMGVALVLGTAARWWWKREHRREEGA